ncbi:MAG: glycosyltransferase family 2 protein [Novosphingobium sp.]
MADYPGTVGQALAQRGWQVPAFGLSVLRGRRSRYCIVIPVINEGERIGRQLRAMAALGIPQAIDTVVVDGGSNDGSLGAELLEATGLRAVITKTGQGRLSAQLRCGYAWALLQGYDGVITIDGNGKDGVESLPNFAAALDDGFDYVQASRFIAGGEARNTPLSRWLAIRLIHAPVLSIAARHWLTDTTQGYRAYSARYLLDQRVQPFRTVFTGYELLAYLTVRAGQIGYRVKELPTSRVYPQGEAVPTKISGLAALWNLMAVMLKAFAGAYAPPRRDG